MASLEQFPGRSWWKRWLLVVFCLQYSVSGLHCHRKHDHSADILLQGDSGSAGSSLQGLQQAEVVAPSRAFYTAKLVQEHPKFENKRDLVLDTASQKNRLEEAAEEFCPNLQGCTCNFTSGANRLQVRHITINRPSKDFKNGLAKGKLFDKQPLDGASLQS